MLGSIIKSIKARLQRKDGAPAVTPTQPPNQHEYRPKQLLDEDDDAEDDQHGAGDPELDFDAWLTDMDDALQRFLDLVPAELAHELDYSKDSLTPLESWLLQRYPDQESLEVEPSIDLADGAARYVGETFVKSLGAHWTLSRKNPRDVYYGSPIVTGHPGETTSICPHRLVGVALHRRVGNFLRMVFDSQNERR